MKKFMECEKPICNFVPVVCAVDNVHRPDTEFKPDTQIRLHLFFEDGSTSDELNIPLSTLSRFEWTNDPRCRYNPEIPTTKAKRYLEDVVRSAMLNIPPKTVYRLSRLGTHIINGEPVFNTGADIIRPATGEEQRPVIQSDPGPYSMDIDPNLPEDEAAAEMFELMSLSVDVGRVVVAHVLLYLMYPVYTEVGKAPCCIPFIFGGTGTQKTALVAFLTQLHNRRKA